MTSKQLSFALKIILIVLIITVLVLAFALYRLLQPPVSIYKTNELIPVLSIYGYGSKPAEQLKQPHDVAFGPKGRLYITDTGHQRVLVFSRHGKFLFKFGQKGTSAGSFLNPLGITVDKYKRVFVADQERSKIVVFNEYGRFLKEFYVTLPLKPLAIGSKLYVANYAFVSVFNLKNLKQVAKWGGKGRARENLNLASGLAVGANKEIYVVDLGNLRLKKLNPEGKVRWVFGQPYNSRNAIGRQFGLPVSAAFDSKYIYVVDAFNSEIVVLNSDRQVLARLGKVGDSEGELYYPAGIAYGGQQIFAVADKFNDRVQLLKITINKRVQTKNSNRFN